MTAEIGRISNIAAPSLISNDCEVSTMLAK